MTEEEQIKFERDNNLPRFTISCRKGEGIKEMLTELGKKYFEQKNKFEQMKGIKINGKKKKKHSCCLISWFTNDDKNETKETKDAKETKERTSNSRTTNGYL